MATRSTIALEYADGTVDQVYCHWDGYLTDNGKILMEHWQDPFKVQKMMDMGAMSALGMEIGDCEFYGRDRGENDVGATRYINFQDYLENHESEEYDYILRTDGQWYVSFYLFEDFVPVSVALEQQERMTA